MNENLWAILSGLEIDDTRWSHIVNRATATLIQIAIHDAFAFFGGKEPLCVIVCTVLLRRYVDPGFIDCYETAQKFLRIAPKKCWKFARITQRVQILLRCVKPRYPNAPNSFSLPIYQSKFCAHCHLKYPLYMLLRVLLLDGHATQYGGLFHHIQASSRFWTSTTGFIICGSYHHA